MNSDSELLTTESMKTDDGNAQKSPASSPTDVVQLMNTRWGSDLVGLAAELGLADLIQVGPKTTEEIAKSEGLHAPTLYRILRALGNFGYFSEQEDGRFAQTQMSDTLRSDVPYSMRGLARMVTRPWSVRAWMGL